MNLGKQKVNQCSFMVFHST